MNVSRKSEILLVRFPFEIKIRGGIQLVSDDKSTRGFCNHIPLNGLKLSDLQKEVQW